MRIRLIRRLAERFNGIDLSRHTVGDIIDLSQSDGDMLIAAGWALGVPVERNGDRRHTHADSTDRSDRLPGKRPS
jgi:hypothetical protein